MRTWPSNLQMEPTRRTIRAIISRRRAAHLERYTPCAASPIKLERETLTLRRMDNVLIVVDDLEAAKAFFLELGLELEGETTVEGPSVDRLVGLHNVRATIALMRTPDGHGRIELAKFHTPHAIRTGPGNAPV